MLFFVAFMSMASAMAQTTTVYAGQTSDLGVVPQADVTYSWELYQDVTGVDFAKTTGNCNITSAHFVGSTTGSTVSVKWLKPGTYFYKVTAYRNYGTASCSVNNLKVGKIVILQALPTAILADAPPICQGDTAYLNVTLTGTGPWNITYSDGTKPITITGITTPTYLIAVNPRKSTDYAITNVTDSTDSNGLTYVDPKTITLVVTPKPSMSRITQF